MAREWMDRGFAGQVKAMRSFAELPIVILTSEERPTTAQRCRQMGLANYVLMPIRRAELFEAMAGLLGSVGNVAIPSASGSEAAYGFCFAKIEEDNAFLMRAYLKNSPYAIEHARDGQAGVNLFRKERFDVVLMDIQMPVLDGHAATRLMREWEAAARQNQLRFSP